MLESAKPKSIRALIGIMMAEEYWQAKIFQLNAVDGLLGSLDRANIVTTNGCFDVFHFGHLMSLYKASQFASFFIVGLNSDASVRRLKGVDRPVCNQFQRSAIIAALPFVDAVVIFDEDTPVEFLRQVRPRFHCKGEDYRNIANEIPESALLKEWGGKLEFIPLEQDLSTTKIVEKFK